MKPFQATAKRSLVPLSVLAILLATVLSIMPAPAAAQIVPEIASPVGGSVLPGPSAIFSVDLNGVVLQSSWFFVGSSVGGDEYGRVWSGPTTTRLLSGLPTDGSTVHVRYAYKSGGSWSSVDTTYTAATASVRLAPVSNLRVTKRTATSMTVAWDADDDWRRVSFDFFVDNSWVGYVRNSAARSRTFENLHPLTSYALGVTAVGDPGHNWANQHYSPRRNITESTLSNAVPEIASPVGGSVLPGSSAVFSVDLNGVVLQSSWFFVGSSVGGDEYGRVWSGPSTSRLLSGLPTDGSTVHVRYAYKTGGSWLSVDTTYTAVTSEVVVWEDGFDTLDLSKWKLEHSTYGDGNNELQCYRPENVSVSNGKLVLRAKHETYTCPNGSTRTVTSGMVRSKNVTFSPGQAVEFRVKLTPADETRQGGLWPAAWASGWAGGGWPVGGEMDWLEVMTAKDPKRSVYTVHYKNAAGQKDKDGKAIYGAQNFSTSWHTVRFDYGFAGQMTWYLDGQQTHQVNGLSTIQGFPAPFDQSVTELKLNLALGGSPGPLDYAALGTSGATFEFDYIRILQM